jgi:hypothetical protein
MQIHSAGVDLGLVIIADCPRKLVDDCQEYSESVVRLD